MSGITGEIGTTGLVIQRYHGMKKEKSNNQDGVASEMLMFRCI